MVVKRGNIMKKDQKFLSKLEECLVRISKKNKSSIILKYRNIIDNEKDNNKKIIDIISELGNPEDIAKKEIEEIKSNRLYIKIIKKIKTIKLNDILNRIKSLFNKKKKISKSKKTKYIRRFKWNFKNFYKNVVSVFKKSSKKVNRDLNYIKEEAVEELKEVKVFETKKEKTKRLIFNIIGIIVITIFIFMFLWSVVLFIASAFSILDGLKTYSVVCTLFGIMTLMLWIILLFYKLIFKVMISKKVLLVSLIVIVFIIGCGAGFMLKQYYDIKDIKDVSEKYTMVSFSEKYNIPDNNKKLYVSFNSNYKTSYIIEYDNKLENRIRVEVKYYECYYDFYAKKSTNNVYISLKLDSRDRLSTYIEGLKDNKIYDTDELSRYVVKIYMNENDKERVIIY